MTAPITVLTCTIPGREQLLAENIASVHAQSIPVACQLIHSHVDDPAVQPMVQYAAAKNALLPAVQTPWVAVLNDDDSWLPHHIETVQGELADVDVLYTWDASGSKPRVDCNGWSRGKLAETFAETNFLDGNCLIRLSLLEQAGGFPTDWAGPGPWEGGHYEGTNARFEDWALWQRLASIGARFRCAPVETWRCGDTPGRISEA
jgi:hypothetical protein